MSPAAQLPVEIEQLGLRREHSLLRHRQLLVRIKQVFAHERAHAHRHLKQEVECEDQYEKYSEMATDFHSTTARAAFAILLGEVVRD